MASNTAHLLDKKAIHTIGKNDRGRYTVPRPGLYPYQWNWDSAFTALGLMQIDEDRAWSELEALFENQWGDGMVPHIVFWEEVKTYYPGPSEWGTAGRFPNAQVPTSGISQPPVVATIVKMMLRKSHDPVKALGRIRGLFPKIARWHEWWHRVRDPSGIGIIATIHPWETGRDNLPDWDEALERAHWKLNGGRIDVSGRQDVKHVDPRQRPSDEHYQAYMALLQFYQEKHWDHEEIAASTPFFVADVGLTAILLRAERDLVYLADHLGESQVEITSRVERMSEGFERLWNREANAYCSLDLRTNKYASAVTAATFLCFYAGITTHGDSQRELLELWCSKINRAVPSFDPGDNLFDHQLYWRGPVWAIVNFMIAVGAKEVGYKDTHDRIRKDTQTLILEHGFAEYYSPKTGDPCGGDAFSWTAAVWIAWVSPSNIESDAGSIFTHIYHDKLWTGGGSGEGSHTPALVDPYIELMRQEAFENDFASKSAVDLGCGDFAVGEKIAGLFSSYVATDVVPKLLSKHRREFGNYHFFEKDLLEDPLPSANIAILRQVLQHWSNEAVCIILAKLAIYDFVYITEQYPRNTEKPNRDIMAGAETRRSIDSCIALREQPFSLFIEGQIDDLGAIPQEVTEIEEQDGCLKTFKYIPSKDRNRIAALLVV